MSSFTDREIMSIFRSKFPANQQFHDTVLLAETRYSEGSNIASDVVVQIVLNSTLFALKLVQCFQENEANFWTIKHYKRWFQY
jgi:hypothetical protein